MKEMNQKRKRILKLLLRSASYAALVVLLGILLFPLKREEYYTEKRFPQIEAAYRDSKENKYLAEARVELPNCGLSGKLIENSTLEITQDESMDTNQNNHLVDVSDSQEQNLKDANTVLQEGNNQDVLNQGSSEQENSVSEENSGIEDTPTIEDTTNPLPCINGFYVGENGWITGFDESQLIIDDGYLEFPSEGCSGISSDALADLPGKVYEVYIPANIKEIGEGAFSMMAELEWIDVDANESFCSIDGVLYSADGTILFAFPSGRIGTFLLPDHVTYIIPGAFSNARIDKLDIHNCNRLTLDEGTFAGAEFEVVGGE